MARSRRRLRRRSHSTLRRRLPALALALVGIGVGPRTASAWWNDGHRIVAEIARRHLSSSARAKIDALLATMPEAATMSAAATWPDVYAKQDPSFDFVFSSHYVNLDRRLSPRELHELCLRSSGCVATGIAYSIEVLRSERASDPQRAEALCFLIHFVGDVHQPLHAGHADDRGGNDIDDLRLLEFTPGAERTNLHAAWDGGLISLAMTREGYDWRRYAAALDADISDEKIARWGRGSAYDWVEESRLFAAANGYLRADGKTSVGAGDVLGEDWYARNLPVVEQRLQQGGVRLALVLDELFSK